MTRSCGYCGADFEARSSRARFCSDKHRAAAARARTSGLPEASAPHPMPIPTAGGTVADAVLAELTAARVADTAMGRAALALAALVDAADPLRASATAAVVKELRATLTDVLRSEVKASDPIDELEARRAARA